MRGTRLTGPLGRKALSDRLALKPYRGKPTVRNFRGGAMETCPEGRSGGQPGNPGEPEVAVCYHLLDEARRRRIGDESQEPISPIIYKDSVPPLAR